MEAKFIYFGTRLISKMEVAIPSKQGEFVYAFDYSALCANSAFITIENTFIS